MRRFFYTLKQAFLQVFRNGAMSFASIFAIMAMLLILGLFFILVININVAAQAIQKDYDSIQIYLLDETTKEEADVMIADLSKQKGADEVYYKDKEAAMAELKERWGDNGYLLDSLEGNPLPNSIVIEIGDLRAAEDIAKLAGTYEGVEDIKFYKETVDKLLDITKYIEIAAIIVMAFLIIVSVLVVSNTIKLTVFNRSSEISIMKYVGATNWFIRGPFLIEGIIIGIFAAGISIGITVAIYSKLVELLSDQMMALLAMPMVPVGFMAYNFTWIFLALGISIGACGSIISMRKFLKV